MKKAKRVFIVISLSVIFIIIASQFLLSTDNKVETYDLLKIFTQAFGLTRSQYVEAVNPKDLMGTAENGLMTSLDGISFIVHPDEMAAFTRYRKRPKLDSGLRLLTSGSFTVFRNVVPHSPADLAGIKPGDMLEKIGDEKVREMPLWKQEDLLNPAEESVVSVHLVQEEGEGSREVKIDVKPYTLQAVEEESGKIRHLLIRSFTGEAVSRLETILAKKHTLILDLRRCSEGDYTQALEAAALIAGDLPRLTLEGKKVSKEEFKPTRDAIFHGEMAVIINSTTSGPAEVFAGLIKGEKGVTLVGTKSAGLVGKQSFIQIGDEGLYLTTATYRVAGHSLHGKGVTPDEIELERSWHGETEEDLLLKKAEEILTKKKAA